MATLSNAWEEEPFPATPSYTAKDWVSTGEELMEWLSSHENTGGAVRLAGDVYLQDFIYVHGLRKPAVTIDTGEFSIIVDDYAEFHAGSPLTIRGFGGGRGLVRTAGGGSLYINGLILEAEDGYAAFQEEGSSLAMEQTLVSGAVHYAELPYVMEWDDGLVVEDQGRTFDQGHLPATLKGRVIRQGQITDFYENVPVIWDLSGHEESQEQRQRFTVTGEFVNMASEKPPVCTIVYDDFPLTFLDVNAKKITGGRGEVYKFTGAFSKPKDRLPIIIAQEYSFDGENWMLDEENEIEGVNDNFTIYLSMRAGEQSPPDIYIRLRWDDGGTMYYSNVLRFAGDSLEQVGDHGGNRGGGTDIINPSGPPEPDPEPPEPPESLGPEPTKPPESLGPEPTKPPESLGSEPPEPPESLGPDPSEPSESLGPPEPPEPEMTVPSEALEPETTGPPEPLELETTAPSESLEWEGALPLESWKEETTLPEISQPASVQNGDKDTAYEGDKSGEGQVSGQEPVSGMTKEPSSARKTVSPLADAVSGTVSASAEGTLKAAEEPGPHRISQRPDDRSAAAGFAVIAASMGAAAIYLHPKTGKRLVERLWKLFKS